MTIKSVLWDTTGIGDGLAEGYNEVDAQNIFKSAFLSSYGQSGVVRNYANEFEVSALGTPYFVLVESGAAIVNGIYCWNDSSTTLQLPQFSNTNSFTIVLGINYTTQTASVYAIFETAPTRNSTVWETPLAVGYIEPDGNIFNIDTGEPSTVGFSGTADRRSFIGSGGALAGVPIKTLRVGSSGTAYTFTGFNPSYSHTRLQADFFTVVGTSANMVIRFNDDTAGHYYYSSFYKPWSSATVTSYSGNAATSVQAGVGLATLAIGGYQHLDMRLFTRTNYNGVTETQNCVLTLFSSGGFTRIWMQYFYIGFQSVSRVSIDFGTACFATNIATHGVDRGFSV